MKCSGEEILNDLRQDRAGKHDATLDFLVKVGETLRGLSEALDKMRLDDDEDVGPYEMSTVRAGRELARHHDAARVLLAEINSSCVKSRVGI